jgi:sugar lactone lactonase YvrE
VTTFAGRALVSGSTDGDRQSARFNDPAAVAVDATGNLYVADSANHVIRKIARDGVVTTIAGRAGSAGFQDGPASLFNSPTGIAISKSGEVIVSDTGNHLVRKIQPSGNVSTIAGAAGQSGGIDALGIAARFDSPLGLTVATNDAIYVADAGNHTVRCISTDGSVTTLAGRAGFWGVTDGQGAAARFNGPLGVALDADGNVFVSDSNNHTIRRVTPHGEVTTWAGAPLRDGFSDGDRRRRARFSKPAELCFDSAGNLYVADSFNHAIRKVSTNGFVTTLTGFSGVPGGIDGINGQASFYNPYSLNFLPDGRLAIADAYNHVIRTASPPIELTLLPTQVPKTLFWNSVIGNRYEVQHAASINGPWLTFGSALIATKTLSFMTDPQLRADHVRIYRIVEAPNAP